MFDGKRPRIVVSKDCRPFAPVALCLSLWLASAVYAAEAAAPSKVRGVKKVQTGLASYYSRASDGKTTARGRSFDDTKMIAAHPRYPFGTVVRVTNLENGKSVNVRIADRGPTGKNRNKGVVIDLSRAAAEALGILKDGVVHVRVEVLKWGLKQSK